MSYPLRQTLKVLANFQSLFSFGRIFTDVPDRFFYFRRSYRFLRTLKFLPTFQGFFSFARFFPDVPIRFFFFLFVILNHFTSFFFSFAVISFFLVSSSEERDW